MKQNDNHLQNIQADVYQVRMQTVNFILSRNAIGFQINWDRFYRRMEFNLENHVAEITKYGTNDKKDTEIGESYRNYMTTAGEYGTFSELYAAAELFGFYGYIFQKKTIQIITHAMTSV